MRVLSMKNKLAYYNDIDPVACAVVEKMIEAALIPDGNVECKSITDIEPEDISDYGAVHMFCGIGLWPLALRQAGWPDPSEGIPNSQVWTGSPPCQPFSVASTSKLGFNDERHLSPQFERLIKAVNPSTVYFEQVSGASGKTWFSALQESLKEGYSTVGISSGACTVGSPMLRKRIYGVADRLMADREEIGRQWWASPSADSERQSRKIQQNGRTKLRLKTGRPSEIDRCERGFTDSSRVGESTTLRQEKLQTDNDRRREVERSESPSEVSTHSVGCSDTGRGEEGMDNANNQEPRTGASLLERGRTDGETQGYQPINAGSEDGDRPTPHYHNFWADPDYIYCRDGYYRPIRSGGGAESATFCLLNGYPGRSASLRLLGNGIVVPQAQAFIESHIEAKIEMEKMNDSNNTD
jgi:DNA (cytosine-5)-methyltransferase 1